MTGVGDRIAEAFLIKANRLLDRAEDPREVLDFAYTQQVELLQQVRRGLADLATGHRRAQTERTTLQESARHLETQAREALAADREDLAREALSRRARVERQIVDLEEQEPLLEAEERRLTAVLERLEARVADFRVRKETLKAEYTRAEAETRVAEAVTGVGDDLGRVGAAVQRATDRTEQLRARSAALGELAAAGTVADIVAAGGPDDVRIELDRIAAHQEAEDELKRLKAERPPTAGPEGETGSGRSAESGGESSV